MNFKSIALCLGTAVLAALPMTAQNSDSSTTTYTFETVNYTGDTFTQLLGINKSGEIAGYHGVTTNKGFTYQESTKVFTKENYPDSAQTQVIGISDSPVTTVGFYIDNKGTTHGFTDTKGTFTRVDFPQKAFNQLLGQNDVGQAVGYYSTAKDGSAPDHPYLYNEMGGVFELLTIPNSTSAQATGINNAGNICGFFVDSNQVNHGWLLVGGNLTQLDYPDSTGTQALGINKGGIVVGFYTDSSNLTHGFTYNSSTKAWQSIDDPDGVGTTVVNGINSKGTLVGFYGTSPINSGFIATPQ
jgi:hypothetical protein